MCRFLKVYFVAFALLSLGFHAQGQVLINEVNADNPGGADNQEFVELYGNPNVSLDSLILVFFDGVSNESYGTFDLNGFQTDSLGFFVIGSALIPSAQIQTPSSFIQNGCDAVALYHGAAADFPNGTLAHNVGLVDALVYVTDDLPISALISALGLNLSNPLYQPFNETNQSGGVDLSQSRLPDGGIAMDVGSFGLNAVSPGWFNSPPCSAGYIFGPNNLDHYYVVQDSIVDHFVWNLSENLPSDSVLFALTDDDGNFLTWLTDTFNYDTLEIGSYSVIGLSFTGSLFDSIVGMPYNFIYSDVCYDWTENIISIEVLQHALVLINEINADNPTGADTGEFIELISSPNASLDNVVVVLYDGATGSVYEVYDLAGQFTDSSGFFVIGSVGTDNVDWLIDNSIIQNGCDAVALYIGHGSDFALGQIAHDHYLLDAMVYVTDDLPSVNLIDALSLYTVNPGYEPFNETIQTNGWDKGQSRYPDGGAPFDNVNMVLQEITPGAPNVVLFGCWDSTACNFNPDANYNSGICLGPTDQCDDGDVNTINDIYNDSCSCVGTLVGLTEWSDQEWFQLFPNPAREYLYVDWRNPSPIHWMISDMMGNQLAIGFTKDRPLKVDLSNFSSGMYSFLSWEDMECKKMTFVISR
jgi:hypothetical protein